MTTAVQYGLNNRIVFCSLHQKQIVVDNSSYFCIQKSAFMNFKTPCHGVECPRLFSSVFSEWASTLNVEKHLSLIAVLLWLRFLGRTVTDVEDEDNEKRELCEADIAGLYRFYSKNLEMPDHKDLLTLFSQVLHRHITDTYI